MGCDIHCFAEKKVNGKWEKLNGFKGMYYDPESDYFKHERFKFSDEPYEGRNYNLFGFLAGVRTDIPPIAGPRGIPEDLSDEIKDEYDKWDNDAHSSSHLYLSELINADWDMVFIEDGFVDLENYKIHIQRGRPSCWSGGVGGGMVEIISKDAMNDIIKGKYQTDENKRYYTEISWEETIKGYCNVFYEQTIPALKERSESENFDDVRIVFWFDN